LPGCHDRPGERRDISAHARHFRFGCFGADFCFILLLKRFIQRR